MTAYKLQRIGLGNVSGYLIYPVVFGDYFAGAIHVLPRHDVIGEIAQHYHGPVSFVLQQARAAGLSDRTIALIFPVRRCGIARCGHGRCDHERYGGRCLRSAAGAASAATIDCPVTRSCSKIRRTILFLPECISMPTSNLGLFSI